MANKHQLGGTSPGTVLKGIIEDSSGNGFHIVVISNFALGAGGTISGTVSVSSLIAEADMGATMEKVFAMPLS